MEEMLTIAAVAARYQTGYRAVARWCERGLIPGAMRRAVRGQTEWAIPARALDTFTPPRNGRPPKTQIKTRAGNA